MCYPLPQDMPLDHAVLIEPLTVGRRAVKQSGLSSDQLKDATVLVIGGGPVGFSVLCNLKAMGVTQTFVSEPTAQRQAQCKAWCSRLLNPMEVNIAEQCRKLTDSKGVDLVFDCAGITPGMEDGMDALRPRGTYVNVAGWESPFVVPMQFFMMKEVVLKASMAYDDEDFAEVVRDFVAGMFNEMSQAYENGPADSS
jgi:threonine dehydrogenase-like Zn-dependent dehydrogenase